MEFGKQITLDASAQPIAGDRARFEQYMGVGEVREDFILIFSLLIYYTIGTYHIVSWIILYYKIYGLLIYGVYSICYVNYNIWTPKYIIYTIYLIIYHTSQIYDM